MFLRLQCFRSTNHSKIFPKWPTKVFLKNQKKALNMHFLKNKIFVQQKKKNWFYFSILPINPFLKKKIKKIKIKNNLN